MNCQICSHSLIDGEACRFCKKRRRVAPCDDDACPYCHTNTLASCKRVVDEWCDTNRKTPRFVWKGSSEPVFVVCAGCKRRYSQQASNCVKHGCALCANKGERRLYDYLCKSGAEVEYQPRFEWAKRYRYDFRVGQILIELDGPQHFAPVRSWKSGFEVAHGDKAKEDLAVGNGFSIVRVLQRDVASDDTEWQKYLGHAMEQCNSRPSVHTPKSKEYTAGIYHRLRSDISFF